MSSWDNSDSLDPGGDSGSGGARGGGGGRDRQHRAFKMEFYSWGRRTKMVIPFHYFIVNFHGIITGKQKYKGYYFEDLVKYDDVYE